MSKDKVIQIVPRPGTGNGPARRARRAGQVPAVVYSHGKSQPVMVEEKELNAVVHNPGLIQLEIVGDRKISGVLKEVQRNSMTGKIIHADIQEVRPDEMITISVNIEAIGVPAGAIQGGQLEQNMRHMDIRIQAQYIFEVLQVDVSKMELNDAMHVSQLELPHGAISMADPKFAVFHVRLPKQEEVKAAEGAEATGKEPEVIAKGKKEEGAEGAAAKPGEKAAAPAAKKK